jgi:lysophospholipid acyltransferase (LPLAT)-like uncharacterized protein
MISRIKQGEIAGMLADGPQGPARVVKVGSVLAARSAQVPIIPLVWGANRCWALNSWDRYLIPKPFAKIVICYGEPTWIPESAKREILERFRLLVEERLNQATRWCDEQFGVERPWRKVEEEGMPEIGPLS